MITKVKRRRLLQVHVETTDYQIREEMVRDVTYWVVPVVMMVEGVHHGSRGPLLYTEEELAASVASWSGMPVTIGHPEDEDGKYISANLPEVLQGTVGRIYNAKMKGDKLIAEAWIDINALNTVSQEAYEYIKEKKALDVSVGVFSNEIGSQGEFNGESYRAEAVNITPDHLALLPGAEGACSWDDGCGIRNNSKDKMKTNKTPKDTKADKEAWLSALLERSVQLITNEPSFRDIIQSLHDQVGRMDSDTKYNYVEEVFEDYFVYCTVHRNTGERSLYKREYKVQEDGSAVLTGEVTKVRREVSFVSLLAKTKPGKTALQRTNFSNNKTKTEMSVNKKCKCTVDSLIQNKATAFTEDDREYLESLSQERLEKFAPKEEEEEVTPVANKKAAATAEKAETKEESLVTKEADGSISINGKSIEDHIKEALKEADPVKFIDNFMPEGVKGQMKTGLKMYNDRRNKQIKEIAANSKFKEEQLKAWSDEDLSALHATVVSEDADGGHYAPLASGSLEEGETSDEGGDEEIAAMMSFGARTTPKEKEEKK